MTNQVLKWGLLSTARINRAVIGPIRTSKRNRLEAVASRSLEKAKAYASEWKIPRAFGSYEEMLADPEIDVIYISLPNGLHAEWTIKAAQAGKHILCEKPLALTEQELDAMQAAVQKAGVVLAEAFMYRHHPQTLKVKQLVADGEIGDLQLVRGSFTFNLQDPGNVRLAPELGGGSIWDVGCYPISYARYLMGAEPLEVFGWQYSSEDGVDLTFAGQMRFPGDVYAQFDSSFRIPFRTQVEVVGSTGSLLIPNPFKPEKREKILLQRGDEVKEIRVPGQELYIGEIEDIADAVLQGKPTRISLDDSRGNLITIRSLLESAQKGTPIHLRGI
jgi:D-xylose 1-dehydrogenase (NADP+, D-xylono-1,5-lactone-forming)